MANHIKLNNFYEFDQTFYVIFTVHYNVYGSCQNKKLFINLRKRGWKCIKSVTKYTNRITFSKNKQDCELIKVYSSYVPVELKNVPKDILEGLPF